METLLIHEDIAPYILNGLEDALQILNSFKGCAETQRFIKAIPATNEDYPTEYLANILNIKVVKMLMKQLVTSRNMVQGTLNQFLSENYTTVNKFK